MAAALPDADLIPTNPQPDLSTIRYLGGKRRLAPWICAGLRDLVTRDRFTLDLFTGSGAMARHLRQLSPVIANDVEPFAYALAEGINCRSAPPPIDQKVLVRFQEAYISNFDMLSK